MQQGKLAPLLQEPTLSLLSAVARRGGITVDEAAEALSLPRTTARFRLERLEQQGFLRSAPAERRAGQRGRSAKVYYLSGEELLLSFPPRSYDFLSRLMAEVLAGAGLSTQAIRATARSFGLHVARGRPDTRGRARQAAPARRPTRRPRKGRSLPQAVTEALKALGGLGYLTSVELASGELAVVTAHNCPFRGVAEAHPGLICAMDLGLWEGVLEAACSAPVKVEVESCQAEGATCCRVLIRPEEGGEACPNSRASW